MRSFLPLVLLLSVVALVGCGTGQVVIPETTTESVTQSIKTILERVAETGDLAIAEELESYIEEELADVDQAKSEALMKDYQELMATSGKKAIQAKAQEMISNL